MEEDSNKDEYTHGFTKDVNDYLNFYIRVADAKAAVFLAGDITVGAALAKSTFCSDEAIIFGAISALSILISIFFGAKVFIPSVSSKHQGFIFWENIKNWSSKDRYLSKVQNLSSSEIENQYAKQNWEVSKILSKKHFAIKWGVVTFLVGFLAYVLSQII
ncbi:Pycsar system effector family protein [Fodinibius halophilus]|uniref:Pycsar effector protein domain-containing protein n=1 Tax=Fodinibius halophilus TaxID=1736908 RepID=A0A6M1T6I0_9BACT|nr:Pycsar system effector family protein [Fodinibius halophilus]NGP89699.1 hypothetical protein [Fodinibius halophilus]